jgi:membrane protein YqaA with SNARE-associated domain
MWATYILVFLASLIVDIVPFIGPPAWTVMVALQMYYDLNIWVVLAFGVPGSAIGRYIYSKYIPLLSNKFITPEKNEDVQFIGSKLNHNKWKTRAFALIYTLMPLPSTPLFTAAGMAKVNTWNIIPSFLVGKFISDAIMVFAGDYFAKNAENIVSGMLSWKTISGAMIGLVLILIFLFIDWHTLLMKKRFRLHFNIWK